MNCPGQPAAMRTREKGRQRGMAPELGATTLIRTKLHRPRLTPITIARPRLTALLTRQRPLTLVIAPAGYGKTTLISSWLEECAFPHAWLTLDKSDDDPAMFMNYLVAALRTVAPQAGAATLALLVQEAAPPVLLARQFLSELDALTQPLVLVLDDYQVITAAKVHAVVGELLQHPHPKLHLVLAARQDPPLPLASLRARSVLTEVRSSNLRFTAEETAAYIRQRLDGAGAEDLAAVLQEQTEGWIAGLHMAAMYLRGQGNPAAHPYFQAGNRHIMDYLLTEVLSQQTPARQTFLLHTAILNWLCAPLCAVVLGIDEDVAQEQLRWLESHNTFLFAMDGRAHWFRYHHLYQQLLNHQLEQQLPRAEIAELHSRAAAWYAGAGLVDEALRHTLAASDTAGAVALVAEHRHRLMNTEQWRTLRRWLALFDRAVIDQSPVLLLTEAWLIVSQGRTSGHDRILARLDELPDSAADAQLYAEAAIIRCEQLYFAQEPEKCIALARAALAALPASRQLAGSYLLLFLAGALQMLGKREEAYAVLEESLQAAQPYPSAFHVRVLSQLLLVQWIAGDLPAMLNTVRRAQPLAAELGLAETGGWIAYCSGLVYYQWNDLPRAAAALEQLMSQSYILTGSTYVNASYTLAQVYQAQGRNAEALAVSAAALRLLQTIDLARAAMFDGIQAELLLRQGNFAGAARWAALHDDSLPKAPIVDAYVQQLTRPKILIAQGSPRALQEATELLEEMRAFLARIHNIRFLIETLALLALAAQRSGALSRGLTYLEQALSLAQPGGFVRVFVDCGVHLLPLLDLAAQGAVAPVLAAQAAAALRAEQQPSHPDAPAGPVTPVAPIDGAAIAVNATVNASLVEVLTPRELKVLTLLAERLTNKEIAHAMGITSDTVKQHTSNLYGKLQVNGRRQAVMQARSLGLLPPT